jgi:hypothetical protein
MFWALALPIAAADWAHAGDSGKVRAKDNASRTSVTMTPPKDRAKAIGKPLDRGTKPDPREPPQTEPADERTVRPIPAADTLEPPPFTGAMQTPPEPSPSAVALGNSEPARKADPAPPAPFATAPPASIRHASEESTPPEDILLASAGERTAPAQPPQSTTAPSPKPSPPSKPEDQAALDILDQIRGEIRGRLPYFQACADAARRRSGLDMRRLQATWFIAADGTIKDLKFDDVPDAQLATCLTRAGGRPFLVQPGMDLTIPTPIVFIR